MGCRPSPLALTRPVPPGCRIRPSKQARRRRLRCCATRDRSGRIDSRSPQRVTRGPAPLLARACKDREQARSGFRKVKLPLISSSTPRRRAVRARSLPPKYAYTRKVNEKVDVFGFGVVLLELTTGKKANDGGEHGSLAEWAEYHCRSGSILDATDICIRYAGYTDEIEAVFRLGVKCTASLPPSRPTMEEVLQILLKCSEQTLRKSRLECVNEYEVAPSLLPYSD